MINLAPDTGVVLHTAGSVAIASGAVVVLRSGATGMIGIAVADIAATKTGAVATRGIATLPKATGSVNAMAVGDYVYWDTGDSNVQKVASANILIGYVVEAANAAATSVKVALGRK